MYSKIEITDNINLYIFIGNNFHNIHFYLIANDGSQYKAILPGSAFTNKCITQAPLNEIVLAFSKQSGLISVEMSSGEIIFKNTNGKFFDTIFEFAIKFYELVSTVHLPIHLLHNLEFVRDHLFSQNIIEINGEVIFFELEHDTIRLYCDDKKKVCIIRGEDFKVPNGSGKIYTFYFRLLNAVKKNGTLENNILSVIFGDSIPFKFEDNHHC